MRICINAVLPRDVTGDTAELPPDDGSGQTAVPLPAIARLNPLNALKPLSAGYLTDQRSFSSDILSSCRMQSIAELDRNVVGWQLSNGFNGEHRTSGTTKVGCGTGENLDLARADMNGCTWTGGAVGEPAPNETFTQIFRLDGASFDPLISAAADIDYERVFTLTSSPSTDGDVVQIDWEITIDAFLAFEGYVERDGDIMTLFTIDPPEGNTVQYLVGEANRTFSGSVTLFPNMSWAERRVPIEVRKADGGS